MTIFEMVISGNFSGALIALYFAALAVGLLVGIAGVAIVAVGGLTK